MYTEETLFITLSIILITLWLTLDTKDTKETKYTKDTKEH